MYWNRSAAEIAATWQTEIESKLESGTTALLLGGAPDNLSTDTATLLALQNSSLERNDIATSLLVTGGNSAAWLGMLLPPQPTSSEPVAPSPTVIFGGADETTYLAMVGLTSAQIANASLSGAVKSLTTTEMGLHFAPRLQPGAGAAWEALPFIEVGEQPTPSLAAITATDSTGDWIAWGTMLLVLCLVLSALLI